MNPLLLSALFSAAPGLISSLFGQGADPQAQLRKQLMQAIGSQGNLTNQFFQQNLASPAFSQGQQQIAAGANATAGQLGASLGARGIGTSGSGAILSSLIPSIVGSQQGQLRTQAYGAAQQQAMNQIQQQIAALQGTSGPSQTRQLFGAGLDAFGPMLQQWLRSKYPSGGMNFGGMGGGIGGGGGMGPAFGWTSNPAVNPINPAGVY